MPCIPNMTRREEAKAWNCCFHWQRCRLEFWTQNVLQNKTFYIATLQSELAFQGSTES